MSGERNGSSRRLVAVTAFIAMLAVTFAAAATEQGEPYSGPKTAHTGPAYFAPAPNPVPYCEQPTYFDPFPENVNPVGRLDITGKPAASVTTDGITMDITITEEGNPDTVYPGFFPANGDGVPNDQAKGVEMAEGDRATITLSEPLFYSQWIFTDVDQPGEAFTVRPFWTEPGQAAAFGGDRYFDFTDTSASEVQLDDVNGQGHNSEQIEGRVQVDFLGAVTGIDAYRKYPARGQSGFALGGGCEAAGAAKFLAAGPTWNGSSFDVRFELRVQNHLPSAENLLAAVRTAQANAPVAALSGEPEGIMLTDLQLTDSLADAGFVDIEVVSMSNPTGGLTLNSAYDGLNDDRLLADGNMIPAETDELIVLDLRYTPDEGHIDWLRCTVVYSYENQSVVTGSAAQVAVTDESDDGIDPAPGADNGSGGTDDPTIVLFPCPPDPTPTPVPPTVTPVPPTVTPTPTPVPPTVTPTPTPTSVPPTVTPVPPTATPVPPTVTPVPPTPTPVPPTVTPEPSSTSQPVNPGPTATSTPEPTATATATPEPTATSTPEPTATPIPEPTAPAGPTSLPYPGPFPTVVPPELPLTDEVLGAGLARTGTDASLPVTAAATMLVAGGVFLVVARRQDNLE